MFIAIYVPLATFIGWIDTKKGSVPVEGAIGAEVNPWVQDLTKALYLMCSGKNEEARNILKKWIKEAT